MRPGVHGIVLVRIAAASMMVIHGVYRLLDLGIGGFGEFLSSKGLPFGAVIAGTLTGVEIAGGLCLLAGRLVRPLCAWFALELLAGIALVHFREGWFVVGAGRNGIEYSVLLILCFAAVFVDAATAAPREAPPAQPL